MAIPKGEGEDDEGNGNFQGLHAPQSGTPLPGSISAQDPMQAVRERQVPQPFRPPPSQPVAQASRQPTDPLCSG